jgi:DNA-binding beta-propeller fold protein YncE
VADVLVSERRDLVFTANRGENSVGIFVPDQDQQPVKLPVGRCPSRLAYDPNRNILLTANAGEAVVPHSGTISVVDVESKAVVAELPLPGHPGKMEYDARVDAFYVNIVEPGQIVVVEAERPTRIARIIMRPTAGPDCPEITTQRLTRFSACGPTKHPIINPRSGEVVDVLDLGGVPDQIVRNRMLHHLYASFGDSGVLKGFDLDALKLLDTVRTERDARTITFYPHRRIFVLLPRTHRAAVYADTA